MKIWLNDLKEGHEFWVESLGHVAKYVHLGEAKTQYFRMPRINAKLVDADENDKLSKIIGEREFFVNQYVYDNEKEAVTDYLIRLHAKAEKIESEISDLMGDLKNTQRIIKKYEEKFGISE